MKFVGGSRHSRDAPDWVVHLVVAGQLEVDVEELDLNPGFGAAPRRDLRVETYVVRTWRTYGCEPFKFLAIADRADDRAYIESLAWPLFTTKG